MGSNHAAEVAEGRAPGAELTAVCDVNPAALDTARKRHGDHIRAFDDVEGLCTSGCVDAVIIATRHYDHPPQAILAFEHGLHVLSEKPTGVYTRQVREMNEAADASGKVFAVMFNKRTQGGYRKLKELVESGELGTLKRNAWIMTSWYRRQAYYDSGDWRATWRGEGGGVLLNQCPHELDLWQWICGMPVRVRAFCAFGKYHDIEVEDEVTAYVEYEDGVSGTFVASTGEAPGSNRFEIAGSRGNLVWEHGKIVFHRNREDERAFNAASGQRFGRPECWRCEIPAGRDGENHTGIIKQFVQAILKDDPGLLIADGREGIRSLELSNAMLLSAWIDDWVTLPIDEDAFYDRLSERISASGEQTPAV
jgi:predicted dehydrogenase